MIFFVFLFFLRYLSLACEFPSCRCIRGKYGRYGFSMMHRDRLPRCKFARRPSGSAGDERRTQVAIHSERYTFYITPCSTQCFFFSRLYSSLSHRVSPQVEFILSSLKPATRIDQLSGRALYSARMNPYEKVFHGVSQRLISADSVEYIIPRAAVQYTYPTPSLSRRRIV